MIYVELNNNSVLNVSDQYIDSSQELNIDSLDGIIDYFDKQKWEYEEYILERLIEIFTIDEDGDVLDSFDIKVSTENRSFNELADMFNERDIEIPEVQRKFVWDTNKCSKLIESILMGLPIPPLFFMDKGKDKYEVIDGLQRLTAISNFILGNSWGNITNDTHRNRPAKLSTNVDSTIRNKTFEQLSKDQQKKLKRSTVTVIDFRQINPVDDKAKYLIFERINTGSELLNPMQIRKALAYGKFMESLYNHANQNEQLVKYFGKNGIHKDRHVEFLLSVYTTYNVLFGSYELKSQYQKYILNDFCETNKNTEIDSDFIIKFSEKFESLIEIFSERNVFKKVNSKGEYHGNRNNNIAEVMLATAIAEDIHVKNELESKYKRIIFENIDKFTVNTVTEELLRERSSICSSIFE